MAASSFAIMPPPGEPWFFDHLDALLGSERGPSGPPSAADSVVVELPALVDRA
ncbi:MAG: hypothetical protein M3394_06185 [Actinomycetota bacterium]|nr:hypothetical protein [Actinomycetota bacterium]